MPTCFADLVPTALAMTTFEDGPYFSRASKKSACSAEVQDREGGAAVAAAARFLLASAACLLRTCCPSDLLEGHISEQYWHGQPGE